MSVAKRKNNHREKILQIHNREEFVSKFFGRNSNKKYRKIPFLHTDLFEDLYASFEHEAVYEQKEVKKRLDEFLHAKGYTKYTKRLCTDFWTIRGYTLEDAIKEISKQQRKASRTRPYEQRKITSRHVCFWTARGLSSTKAAEKVRRIQTRDVSFWRSKGLSENEAYEKKNHKIKKWQSSLQLAIEADPSINKRKGKTFLQHVEKFGESKAQEILRQRLKNILAAPAAVVYTYIARNKGLRGSTSAKELLMFEDHLQHLGFKQKLCLKNPRTKQVFCYDFYHPTFKVAVEFNGDF